MPTKYYFNNDYYTAGRLVQAIVQKYVKDNPNITYDKLYEIFPLELQGAIGVFSKLEDAKEHSDITDIRKYYISEDDIIELKDASIAICSHWGAANINNILSVALNHGYIINSKNR